MPRRRSRMAEHAGPGATATRVKVKMAAQAAEHTKPKARGLEQCSHAAGYHTGQPSVPRGSSAAKPHRSAAKPQAGSSAAKPRRYAAKPHRCAAKPQRPTATSRTGGRPGQPTAGTTAAAAERTAALEALPLTSGGPPTPTAVSETPPKASGSVRTDRSHQGTKQQRPRACNARAQR